MFTLVVLCCSSVQKFNASQSFTIQGTPYSTGVKFALCSSLEGEIGRQKNGRPTCGSSKSHAYPPYHISAPQVTKRSSFYVTFYFA